MSYLRQIKVGIGSYSENTNVVQVQGNSLFTGDINVVGVITANRLFSTVHGEFTGGISGTNIVGTSLSISGASSFGGDVNVVGVLTANRLYSNVYGEFTGGGISGTNIVGTALSISGISTFSGEVNAVTYYGGGGNLTGLTAKRIAMAIVFG